MVDCAGIDLHNHVPGWRIARGGYIAHLRPAVSSHANGFHKQAPCAPGELQPRAASVLGVRLSTVGAAWPIRSGLSFVFQGHLRFLLISLRKARRLPLFADVKARLVSCLTGAALRSTGEPPVVLPTPPPIVPRNRATAGFCGRARYR